MLTIDVSKIRLKASINGTKNVTCETCGEWLFRKCGTRTWRTPLSPNYPQLFGIKRFRAHGLTTLIWQLSNTSRLANTAARMIFLNNIYQTPKKVRTPQRNCIQLPLNPRVFIKNSYGLPCVYLYVNSQVHRLGLADPGKNVMTFFVKKCQTKNFSITNWNLSLKSSNFLYWL